MRDVSITLTISALAIALALAIAPASAEQPGTTDVAANAAEEANSNWPCVQRKVDKLTSAQIWDGPPVDDIRNWWEDKEVSKLVRYLISRRIPIEEAETAIAKFAGSTPEGPERDKRLTLLFAGILQESNSVRSSIVNGIERFQERQLARAAKLKEESSKLAELHKRRAAGEDVADEINKAQELYDWDARVFKEREDNIPLACEIPVEIEQRAFGLGRAIRFHMS
ncbi:MAG: hypothetical protein KJ587_01635 [Alphaproteobacteria bacterium]|nr:hypothetical protein [Alphaproteobacteria bacterium]